jgi:hypothetical protein
VSTWREHITLGYASTVHSAQGMTIGNSDQYGVCWSILSDRASRAVAYVGMTRGRDENHLAIYPAVTNEADQRHHSADTNIHQMHRGTKHAAAHALHMILTANDDRARIMHAVGARTDRDLLPTIVAALFGAQRPTPRPPRTGLAPTHRPNPRSRSRPPTLHRHPPAGYSAPAEPWPRQRPGIRDRIMNAGNNLKQRNPETFLCYRSCRSLDLIDAERVYGQKIDAPHRNRWQGTTFPFL